MSLLLIEGFDVYDDAHMRLVWGDIGESDAAYVNSSVYRTSGRSYWVTGQSTFRGRTFAAASRLVVGFAIRGNFMGATGVHTFARFANAVHGKQLVLATDTAGRLILRLGATSTTLITGGTALSDDTWYYVELKVRFTSSTSAGDCEIRINGVVDATIGAGVNTDPAGTGTADRLEIGLDAPYGEGGGMYGREIFIDDLYVLDTAGSAPNNDYLGDCSVETLVPTGAGATTQWTPSTGSNWQNVDDIPPDDDTTYNSTATAGNVDLYAMGNLASAPVSIYGVAVQMWMKKDASGSRLVAPVVRMGGVNYQQASVSVGSSYASSIVTMTARPSDSAPWTGADVDGMEVGIKLVS